jgi:lipopolysaccharide/colanic/teichoic acid biosynthesis glycosyltransferase
LRAINAARFQKRLQYRIKRLFDFVVSAVLLVLLSPVFLLIAVSIKLTSRGPVFYTQQRLKQNGIEFRLFKFRTMVADADARLEQVFHLNQASGPLFKLRKDPRTTRVGRVLRSTFFDELPQLINVLRGDMSLVGPRPILARERDQMEKEFLFRFAVPQGITGPWQVSGHYAVTITDQLQAERDYVATWSFTKDIGVLMRTVPLVLRRCGI